MYVVFLPIYKNEDTIVNYMVVDLWEEIISNKTWIGRFKAFKCKGIFGKPGIGTFKFLPF